MSSPHLRLCLSLQPKVIEILRESKSYLESAFISSGNSFAAMRLSARQSLVGYLGEVTQGVTYYQSVLQLLDQGAVTPTTAYKSQLPSPPEGSQWMPIG